MKKIFTFLFLASALSAAADNTGIFLSGTMNDWAKDDATWELQTEPDMPGWAYIDLTGMAAGTEFRIVGHGRDFGMKNTRNTFRPNSMHLTTLDGEYNIAVGEAGLDGVHLMVYTEDFKTTKYGSVITRNADTKTIYGACMKSSVEPTVLASQEIADWVEGEVDITEPWYIIKAYGLSNATQTVTNYGLSASGSNQLVPTSFMTPTADPIAVPEDGNGKYVVAFNTKTMVYQLGSITIGVEEICTDSSASAVYYNLQGQKVEHPTSGLYIKVSNGRGERLMIDD